MMGVTIILVLALGFYTFVGRYYEGFADKSPETVAEPNALLSLMGNLKRMSGYLINPTTWTDRIAIMNMSPTELARHYIKSQNNVE
jgi:hypothetical protein